MQWIPVSEPWNENKMKEKECAVKDCNVHSKCFCNFDAVRLFIM